MCTYVYSGCSVCFGKRTLFPEFMWKKAKNPLEAGIANNSIMSHNEAIEELSIRIGGVQYIISVLCTTNQPSRNIIIEDNFQMLYSPCTHTTKPNNIHNKWSLSSH